MIFPDGNRRAGHFEMNIFKSTLKTPDQIDQFRDLLDEECIRELEKFLNIRSSKGGIGGSAANQPLNPNNYQKIHGS